MNDAELLATTKANLGLEDYLLDAEAITARDNLLTLYISSAKAYLTEQGAVLSDSEESTLLIISYVSWMYGHPNDKNRPRSVVFHGNNKIFKSRFDEAQADESISTDGEESGS